MAEARLAAGIWVSVYLARLAQVNIPVYVLKHGDDTAGAVAVKCATLDGQATLWQREWDYDTDRQVWRAVLTGDESQIDQRIARERAGDPDLWVIEIESRDGTTLLDQMV